jgi:HAD superfamily hydrolase (TIGR01484 family)
MFRLGIIKKVKPKHWNVWSAKTDTWAKKRNILAFDIDDTLTVHGRIPALVLRGFEYCQKEGLRVLLVTGRPAGWADALVKMFPIDGVIAENGAVIFYWKNGLQKKRKGEEPARAFWQNPSGFVSGSVTHDKPQGFSKIQSEILRVFPKARISSDQFARLYDLAIDFAEEVNPPMGLEEANQIRAIFEKHGATAKVSSIHVNGWFGDFSKLSGLQFLVEDIWNRSLQRNTVYVGDSPNDGPLFDSLDCTVGVANVKKFFNRVDFAWPKFITQKKTAEGAIEVIQKILGYKIKQ